MPSSVRPRPASSQCSQVRDQRHARQRVRVSERRVPGPQPVYAVPGRCADRPVRARDRAQPVGCQTADRAEAEPWFFFGDYPGTRATQGGSKLLTVPTVAARGGNLSAYGVEHLRSGRTASSSPATHPRSAGCGAGGGAAEADSRAERRRTATTAPRQLRGQRLGGVHGELVQRPRGRPAVRQPQHVRPLQRRRFPARRADRVWRGRGLGARQPWRRVRRDRTRAWRSASTRRSRRRSSPTSASASSGTRSTCCRSISAPGPPRTREFPD